MKPQPKYYITKRMFGMIIQIPVTASEIEALHNQLVADSMAPSEDPLQVSIFDTPEEPSR